MAQAAANPTGNGSQDNALVYTKLPHLKFIRH